MKNYLLFVTMHTGYVGSTSTEVISFKCEDPEYAVRHDANLEVLLHEMARENAESYSLDMEDCGECKGCVEGGDCTDQHESDSFYATAAVYEPYRHDVLRAGGGSFLEGYEVVSWCKESKCFYVPSNVTINKGGGLVITP